jgi:hypothetical protein
MIAAMTRSRRPASPPPGAGFALVRISPAGPAADAAAILKAAGLPLVRPAGEVVQLLNDAAERWLMEASAFPLDGAPPGAPPSERAVFCDRIADAAEALLGRLGASPNQFAVVSRGEARAGWQLDPHSKLQDGLDNLDISRMRGLPEEQRAQLLPQEADIELLLAPLLTRAPVPAKCACSGAAAITDDVLARAVAGVELLKRLGRLEAAVWRHIGKASKSGRRQGGARLAMARRLARIYAHAFGCDWQEQGVGRQAKRTHRFVRFLDAFARHVADAADPATIEACGPQGPKFRPRTAKDLCARLQREAAASPKNFPEFGEVLRHRRKKTGRNK